mmetsp:Transcript_18861/g.41947  ORF Transcript_18861/g.41947 Transcript_18861/m.41947 type:complete len:302 (-) Transcript_18861:204-1109(-)
MEKMKRSSDTAIFHDALSSAATADDVGDGDVGSKCDRSMPSLVNEPGLSSATSSSSASTDEADKALSLLSLNPATAGDTTGTATTGSATDPMASTNATTNNKPRKPNTTKLKVRIKRWHAVARWTWNVNGGSENNGRSGANSGGTFAPIEEDEEEDVCTICQSAFEGTAPGVKYPGDECPVVWGKCGHSFHLTCVSTWLSDKSTCPYCRAEWEFGADQAATAQENDEDENEDEGNGGQDDEELDRGEENDYSGEEEQSDEEYATDTSDHENNGVDDDDDDSSGSSGISTSSGEDTVPYAPP